MSKTFCIVGAGELDAFQLAIPENAFVIAADGGLSALEKAGISADLTVGDFDSLGRVPEGENVIVSPAEKDDTDTMLAVKLAIERGAEKILIFGGMGGRFEHSIANIQALGFIANRGARGFLIGQDCFCTVIKNSEIKFSEAYSGFISVFAFGGIARGVDLKGLKYPLSNHTLTTDFPLGVSNEFCRVQASVSVEDGSLLVIWHTQENMLSF